MTMVLYFLLFIFGTAFGSFVNVLHLRYSPERSVFDFKAINGRSRCIHCGKTLGAWELVPILSFIFLGGRCKNCGKHISFQYPAVEFLSGVVFLTVPLFLRGFFQVPQANFINFTAPAVYYGVTVLWLLVFLIWMLIALIDLKHYLIPDELNVALGFLGALLLIFIFLNPGYFSGLRDSFLGHYNLLFSFPWGAFLNHVAGGVAGFIFFAGISVFTKGKAMGMGDAKLALPSGLLLGWADIGLAIALSFILGGMAGVFLISRKKKTIHDKIPFAPFLILGFALTFFLGEKILSGYFALFPVI